MKVAELRAAMAGLADSADVLIYGYTGNIDGAPVQNEEVALWVADARPALYLGEMDGDPWIDLQVAGQADVLALGTNIIIPNAILHIRRPTDY